MGKELPLNQKTITGPAHLTDIWPQPPVEEATEYISAGPLTIGVEYRYLKTADPEEGVSLHVCGEGPGGRVELLRFDCFEEEPHYHYMTEAERRQMVYPMDPAADGDPLEWALGRLAERMAPMLATAGAEHLAVQVERRLDEVRAGLVEVGSAARQAVEQVRRQQMTEAGTPPKAAQGGA
jgi:hypothetical protein